MQQLTDKYRDKLSSAIHEAGHLVVAAIHGATARAWIEETGATDLNENRAWVGKASVSIGLFTEDARRQWAIAGDVANILADDSNVFAECIVEFIELELTELSSTDAAIFAGTPQQQYEAIEGALTILRENQAFLNWAVEQLMDEEVITDGMVRDYLHGEPQ